MWPPFAYVFTRFVQGIRVELHQSAGKATGKSYEIAFTFGRCQSPGEAPLLDA